MAKNGLRLSDNLMNLPRSISARVVVLCNVPLVCACQSRAVRKMNKNQRKVHRVAIVAHVLLVLRI